MKKTLTLAAALFASAAFAQSIVSISPSIATGADTITITLDANIACTGSASSVMSAPEVRIHSGVGINGNNWQNVVAFDDTSRSTILTADPNNAGFYSITLVPNDYYNVTSGSVVTALCMVFNGGSWTYEAKGFEAGGTNCVDFIIPLYGLGLNEGSLVNDIYPNPTSGELNIDLVSKKSAMAYVNIMNLLGQSVMVLNPAVEAGANSIKADLNVANGTYFVEVVVDGMKSVKRVVVSH